MPTTDRVTKHLIRRQTWIKWNRYSSFAHYKNVVKTGIAVLNLDEPKGVVLCAITEKVLVLNLSKLFIIILESFFINTFLFYRNTGHYWQEPNKY